MSVRNERSKEEMLAEITTLRAETTKIEEETKKIIEETERLKKQNQCLEKIEFFLVKIINSVLIPMLGLSTGALLARLIA